MGRKKLDISDEERYERHKARMREYKKNRLANDPEFARKCKEYNQQYWKNLVENANKKIDTPEP